MNRQEHQIDRFQIRMKSKSRRFLSQQHQELSYLLHTAGFKQQLESVFDQCTPTGDVVELPVLKIKLRCPDSARLGELLLVELAKNLQRTIAGRNNAEVVHFTEEAFKLKVLEEYLQYGTAFRPGAWPVLQEWLAQLRSIEKIREIDPDYAKIIYALFETSSIAVQ